jgi:hypothetical protein
LPSATTLSSPSDEHQPDDEFLEFGDPVPREITLQLGAGFSAPIVVPIDTSFDLTVDEFHKEIRQ